MSKRTEINQMGEFKLIDRIKKRFELKNDDSFLGIGDDAAVIKCGNKLSLVSNDLLLENIHFDLSYAPLKHVGYKSVAVNASDIAAMNGLPEQITIGLGLSNRFSVEAVDALYDGISLACKNYNIDVVGGDTCASSSGLIISINALGKIEKSKLCLRSGAQPKDIVCVTGDLGAAYLGLQVLVREKEVFSANPEMQPDLVPYQYLVQRQLKPEARLDIIHELRDLGVVPTAMIDVSDGLSSELLHIAKNSQVSIKIYEDKLPISQLTYQTAIEMNIDPVACMLNGGEDYELLFTISPNDLGKLEKHPDIHFIGTVEEKKEKNILITKNNNKIELTAQGWKAF